MQILWPATLAKMCSIQPDTLCRILNPTMQCAWQSITNVKNTGSYENYRSLIISIIYLKYLLIDQSGKFIDISYIKF